MRYNTSAVTFSVLACCIVGKDVEKCAAYLHIHPLAVRRYLHIFRKHPEEVAPCILHILQAARKPAESFEE